MLWSIKQTGTPTKQGSNRMSPILGASSSSGSTDSFSDRQFIAITSEKTARVIALPSQNCVYRQQIADTDYVVKAEVISLKGTRTQSHIYYKRYKMQRRHFFQFDSFKIFLFSFLHFDSNSNVSSIVQIAFVWFAIFQRDIW